MLRGMPEPTDYAMRLMAAMGVPVGKSRDDRKEQNRRAKELAAVLGVDPNAVTKVLRGGTKQMSAENSSKAARHLKVDPDWLATGEGSMHSSKAWPFGAAITPAQFFALDIESVQPAIDVLVAAVDRQRRKPRVSNG